MLKLSRNCVFYPRLITAKSKCTLKFLPQHGNSVLQFIKILLFRKESRATLKISNDVGDSACGKA